MRVGRSTGFASGALLSAFGDAPSAFVAAIPVVGEGEIGRLRLRAARRSRPYHAPIISSPSTTAPISTSQPADNEPPEWALGVLVVGPEVVFGVLLAGGVVDFGLLAGGVVDFGLLAGGVVDFGVLLAGGVVDVRCRWVLV
jgi:hypothetical protein